MSASQPLRLLPPGGPDPVATAAQAAFMAAREAAVDAVLAAHSADRTATRHLPTAERRAARRASTAACMAKIDEAHATARASRAAHFRRQQNDSLALLAGMMAEREERAAVVPQDGRSASDVLADLSAAIDRAGACL